MTDLKELHQALETIKRNGKSAKLFFYFLNPNSGQMQSGFFAISQGESCCISFLSKPNDEALDEIPQLTLTKVTSLPAASMDLSNQPFPVCALDEVIARLNPANHTKPLPAPEPEAPRKVAVAEPAMPSQPYVFYSHVAMQRDATSVLETLYGSSAQKKVDEIALKSPPHQYPKEFLDKCKLLASMMLGAAKADQLFQPIYGKLAHGHAANQ